MKPKRKTSISKIAKKVKPKTVRYLRKLAWSLLSQIIRQQYADHRGMANCFTCDEVKPWRELQAGHAIGGRHNAVLLDESIIRPQCPGCNIFKRGNYQVFVTKLIRQNGLDWWEKKLMESRQLKTYSREELNEIILNYRIRLAQPVVGVFDELEWMEKKPKPSEESVG